jgi:outer membrane protein assembly factor BamB
MQFGRMSPLARRLRTVGLAMVTAVTVTGCESLQSWIPTIPTPSLAWLGIGKKEPKPGPLPAFDAKATPRVGWQVAVGGKGNISFAPAYQANTVYAAAPDGAILSVDASTGQINWRIKADKPLTAGVGAGPTAIVVGTNKGDVLAYDLTGKPTWEAKVSTEVAGPPAVGEGKVIVWALDGRIYGLSEADGSQKWIYQRTNPPLTVRRFAGGTIVRGGLFTGTAGGKLLALDPGNGVLGWDANVATPKGATELERIADVTSLPVVQERQVCAAAYQGRVACFDAQRGTLTWSRDFSSLAGIAVDNRYLYLTDDKGSIYAFDKTTGASVWKQSKLEPRFPSGPVILGDYLGIVDGEGYVHLLDRNDGGLVGRTATDGSAAVSQPITVGESAVWQSAAGNLISVGVK